MIVQAENLPKAHHEIARRLLLQAIEQHEALNKFNQGYAQGLLGDIEQQRQQFALAEQHYRQAIALGDNGIENESACINLGAMWEAQKQYDKVLKVYTDCLPTLKSALLLMNLGTLYYNGLGMPRDMSRGADYWQQSFEMFSYDPDVNYNLGLYHLQITHDFTKARYHFALANALGDLEAARKIADPAILGRYADGTFADELRHADKDRRRELLQDRLRYTLEKRFFNTAREGVIFHLSEDSSSITLSGKPENAKARDRAIIQMFWLLYVDRFSAISWQIRQTCESVAKTGEAELLLHKFILRGPAGHHQPYRPIRARPTVTSTPVPLPNRAWLPASFPAQSCCELAPAYCDDLRLPSPSMLHTLRPTNCEYSMLS